MECSPLERLKILNLKYLQRIHHSRVLNNSHHRLAQRQLLICSHLQGLPDIEKRERKTGKSQRDVSLE